MATILRAELSGDRIPVRCEIFRAVQTGPETHPASCTGSFRAVNRSGRGVDNSTLFQLRGCEWMELYLRLPFVPARACHGITFTFTFTPAESLTEHTNAESEAH